MRSCSRKQQTQQSHPQLTNQTASSAGVSLPSLPDCFPDGRERFGAHRRAPDHCRHRRGQQKCTFSALLARPDLTPALRTPRESLAPVKTKCKSINMMNTRPMIIRRTKESVKSMRGGAPCVHAAKNSKHRKVTHNSPDGRHPVPACRYRRFPTVSVMAENGSEPTVALRTTVGTAADSKSARCSTFGPPGPSLSPSAHHGSRWRLEKRSANR